MLLHKICKDTIRAVHFFLKIRLFVTKPSSNLFIYVNLNYQDKLNIIS